MDQNTGKACGSCGFGLWKPYGELSVSSVGLYSDARFPGRSIVSLEAHFEQLDEVPAALLSAFMDDVRTVSLNLKAKLHVERTNVAILGNAESHVHAHVFPRRAEFEPEPRKSPWDDPRPREALVPESESSVFENLRSGFLESSGVKSS